MTKGLRFGIYGLLVAGGIVFRLCNPVIDPESRVLGRKAAAAGKSGELEIVSSPYRIDRMYRSMEGPSTVQERMRLSESHPDSATLFVTGVESEVVDAQTLEKRSPEFFCHANLTLCAATETPEAHNGGFSPAVHADWRLFTLVPGKLGMKLPPGFGVPIHNKTRLDYLTMVLNQNQDVPVQDIRIRTRVTYADSSENIRPVFRRSVYVYQSHKEGKETAMTIDPKEHQGEKCGESCKLDLKAAVPSVFADLGIKNHPGASCCVENASADGVMQQFGSNNTIHWMVPPGTHSYTTDVSKQMNLPYNTRAHYITGHLHPTGVKLKLVDNSSGATVAEIQSADFKDKTGVQDMTEIVSQGGIPFKKDGQYSLVAEYNNTTGHPIDAMAILYLYLSEKPDGVEGLAAK
ncbi:MAG TPA: hypothetical protein VHM91_09140 [Verrucomicrobiales bacterium]|nr:hypothetical protein [Verrucomicrobiales bacterium]